MAGSFSGQDKQILCSDWLLKRVTCMKSAPCKPATELKSILKSGGRVVRTHAGIVYKYEWLFWTSDLAQIEIFEKAPGIAIS